MNDGTLETIDGRNVLCFRRRLNHSAERVWRALADTDEQEHWFPAGEPLRVTVSEPSRLLEGTWFGDTLRFALTPEGDGCVLEFTHTFADRAIAARTAAGWDRCLARLQALLAGARWERRNRCRSGRRSTRSTPPRSASTPGWAARPSPRTRSPDARGQRQGVRGRMGLRIWRRSSA